jgi:hypothetical protein
MKEVATYEHPTDYVVIPLPVRDRLWAQFKTAEERAKALEAINRRVYRNMMMPEEWYQKLDLGIRFAVRILHARGIETCQSCQGGDGHCYDRPTVDLPTGPEDAIGFGAVFALRAFGLPVREVALVWPVWNGLPYEKLWRITFYRTMEDRADEQPNFVWSYEAR